MSRNFTYSALTLRTRPFGESNREAWFLTPEEGILKAAVFGGAKSRLRSRVAPYHEGTLFIYHDPVRDSRKVSDFDVGSFRPGIRELWERAMTAAALAETILASHGGGSWPEAFRLAGSVLDVLDTADASLCARAGVYFLRHWAQILGIRQELSVCAACACEVKRDEVLWYFNRKEALFCANCARNIQEEGELPSVRVGAGARLWLGGIETLPPEALARFSLDAVSLEQAGTFCRAVLAGALGRKLSAWDSM